MTIIFRLIYIFINVPTLGITIFMSLFLYIPALIIEYIILGALDKKTSNAFYKMFCFIDDVFIEKRKGRK